LPFPAKRRFPPVDNVPPLEKPPVGTRHRSSCATVGLLLGAFGRVRVLLGQLDHALGGLNQKRTRRGVVTGLQRGDALVLEP
jgi:hypothetical protein